MDTMENDTLASYLNALARDDCYRVQNILKEAPHETTEIVYFTGATGGELGPFVRKRINDQAGIGKVYEELFNAQQTGRRFRHLPHIYDVHKRDDQLVVIMEYVTGRTLHDEVYERDASVALAKELFPALCDGVIELHQDFPAPIIHRDLKPSNVIINEGGLTIIDFGIARTYHPDAQNDTTQFGTRSYAPPEQFGYGQTDVRSDIYALGMILYYLLTERNPDPTIVAAGFPDIAFPPLRSILIQATAFDPKARFQSVQDLKNAFLEACKRRQENQTGQTSGPSQINPTSSIPSASASRANSNTLSPYAATFASASASFAQQKASPTEILGLIWDVLIAMSWATLVCICFSAAIFPTPENAIYPLGFRLGMFVGFGALFFTGIAYALLDKRWLRRHISFMANQTFGRGLIIGAIIVGASLLVLVALIVVLTVTNYFGAGPPPATQ